jgi:hypothetical protein
MEGEEKYLSKKDLEKLYNKEEGYYNSYDNFEDLICNVCGKIIHGDGSREYFESEQDYADNDELVTFCSECVKLPNKLKLVKIPV